MKKCSYCGSFSDDNSMVCPSCGASDFMKVCPECGDLYSGMKCPKCESRRPAQPVNTEPVQQSTPSYSSRPAYSPAPEKKSGCLVTAGKVMLWICFFPIMATIAILKSRMNVVMKLLLLAAVWGAAYYIGKKEDEAPAVQQLPVISEGLTEKPKTESPSGLYLAPVPDKAP